MTMLRLDHSKLRMGHDEILNGLKGFKQFELYVNTNGKEGKQTVSSSQPTRIGKGEQMRTCSYAAVLGWVDKNGQQHQPFASLVILASPTSALAAQVVRPAKMRNSFELFGIDEQLVREAPFMRLSSKTDGKTFESLDDYGRCKVVSCTNDLILSRQDKFIELCKQRKAETGLPVLIWFDEVQRVGEATHTHAIAELLLADGGALIKSTTATPCRSDGGMIHGFEPFVKLLEESTVKRVVGRREDDPNFVDVDVLKRQVCSILQVADITVPWKYAFNENCLCQLNIELIPVEASLVACNMGNDDGEILSAMAQNIPADSSGSRLLSSFWDEEEGRIVNEAQLRRFIGAAVRDPDVIRRAVKRALEFLQARRRIAPTSKLMVFGGNDKPDGSDNEHLELIKRIIHSEWELYFPGTKARCMICTMKDGETAAAETVMDRLDDFETGPYDVILLKQMAAEGWDTKVTKVQLNLSPIRAYSTNVQMLFRVATPWEFKPGEVMLTGDIVSIHDPFMEQHRRWLHDSQGPITRQVEMTKVDAFVAEYKPQPEGRDQAVLITSVEGGGRDVWGENRPVMPADEAEIAMAIRRHFPDVQARLNDAQLVDLWRRGAFQNVKPGAAAEPEPDPFTDQGERLRKAIAEATNAIQRWINRAIRLNGGGKLNGSYGEAVSLLTRAVVDAHNAKRAGDHVPAKFSGITNPEVAERFAVTASSDQWGDVAKNIVARVAATRGAGR